MVFIYNTPSVYLREQKLFGWRNEKVRYSSDITTGSLKVPESRIIADMLLQGITGGEEWKQTIFRENVLQMRGLHGALRLASLLKRRLQSLDPSFLNLVRDGNSLVATQACLAGAIKSSPLLGDFLLLVVADEFRIGTPALTNRHWQHYLEGCRNRDPHMGDLSDSTAQSLRQVVYRILSEAGYINNTRDRVLQRLLIENQVLDNLKSHNERYVLQCIQVTA